MKASDAPETYFFNALRQGRIELQLCSDTGRPVFYPRTLSPYTGSPLTQWRSVSGLGTVYSTTAIRQRPDKGGDYNVALVDLDEGVRMMAQVRDVPADRVTIGMRVVADIEQRGDDNPLIFFRPVGELHL
ncbi:MAG TPA: Zn-ribbon domain-containing OB-fold protein [Xanthobacteraceae bacterium]|nr:Zn-ribbon domain-containing OB-fold protein [Xanthobacteraceae bacterium]